MKYKIMQYKIVISAGIISIQDIVNRYIKEGWEPLGGISYNPKTERYLQSLTKKHHE